MVRFAVLDTETTGVSPRYDRVVDLAVGVVTSSGDLVARLDTVVCPPDAPVDAPAEVFEGAPRFADIANRLGQVCSGTVVVAHNAAFDRAMLTAEYARLGVASLGAPWLDTLALARRVDPALPGGLSPLYGALGLSGNPAWHTASGDVDATVAVLLELLDRAARAGIDLGLSEMVAGDWPDVPPSDVALRPRNPELWPARSAPRRAYDPALDDPEFAARAEGGPASSGPVVVTLPEELLEKLRALPPDPQVARRRREQARRLAEADGVVDLETAREWLDTRPFDGPDGWHRLRQVVRTLRVAEEWEDLLEALQRQAGKLGQRRRPDEAAEIWVEYASVAIDAYPDPDDADELVWDLEKALSAIIDVNVPLAFVVFDEVVERAAARVVVELGEVLLYVAESWTPSDGLPIIQAVLERARADEGLSELEHAARIGRARHWEREGRLAEAAGDLENLHRAGVRDGRIYDRLSLIYERSGQLTQAAGALERGLAVDPGDTTFLKRKARINRQLDPAPRSP